MNLIFAFTSGLTAYSVYVNFQGHMHRVQDIFPGLSVLQLLLFSPAPSSPNPCARCCSMLPTTQYQPVGHDDDDSGLEEGLLLSQYTHAGRNQEDLRMTTATMPMERQMLLTLRNFSLKLRGTHGNHRCLVDKLNLSISCNMRLLITGKTGAGKSQLLHYIAHLFRIGQQAPSTAAIHAVDGCGADNHPTDKIMAEYEYAQVDRELGKEDVYVCPQAAYNQMQVLRSIAIAYALMLILTVLRNLFGSICIIPGQQTKQRLVRSTKVWSFDPYSCAICWKNSILDEPSMTIELLQMILFIICMLRRYPGYRWERSSRSALLDISSMLSVARKTEQSMW